MTSNLETDAILEASFNSYSTVISFQSGNLGYNSTSQTGLPSCDLPVDHGAYPLEELHYVMYMHFLPERDFSESAIFDGIRKMVDSSSVMENGNIVSYSE